MQYDQVVCHKTEIEGSRRHTMKWPFTTKYLCRSLYRGRLPNSWNLFSIKNIDTEEVSKMCNKIPMISLGIRSY